MDPAPQASTLAGPPLPQPASALRPALLGFGIDALLALVITFALILIAGMGWGVIEAIRLAMAGVEEGQITAALSTPGALVQILCVLFAMGTAALVLYAWRQPAGALERRQSWQALQRGSTWLAIVATAVLTFGFSTLATWLGERFGAPPNPSNLQVISEVSEAHPLFVLAFAVVLAPLYEELLFRRVLFGRLWRAGYPWLGMLLSGAAFALAHEMPGANGNGAAASALLLVVYASMGMAFAWVYRRTGTLWAPIAAHALNNALAMAGLRFLGG